MRQVLWPWRVVVTLACLHGHSALLSAQQASPEPATPAISASGFVFQGVTVVGVIDGRLQPEQSVLITGTRIKAVGPVSKISVPPGAQVVDARGKYLIPGLWDMHAHVDEDVDELYPLFIAHGVTGLREMAQRGGVTTSQFRQWQREVAAGTRVGPRVAGPSADVSQGAGSPAIEKLEDARRIIDSLKAAGMLFLKYHGGSTPEFFFTIARETRRAGLPLVGHVPRAFAREARRAGLPLAGHVPRRLTDVQVSDSGMHSIEHGDNLICWVENYDQWKGDKQLPFDSDTAAAEQRCAQTVAAFKRNNTWFTPTLVTSHWISTPIRSSDNPKAVRLLRRLGFTQFLAGADAGSRFIRMHPRMRAGLSLLEELTFFVEGGLTPLEALQTATLNPAKFFKATDSLGTVTPGKLADLVLLDANPVADIRNVMTIRAVVANGRYFDRAALDALDPEGLAVAKQSVKELAAHGRILRRGLFGAYTSDAKGDLRIHKIIANTPAEAAGLKVGDVIVAINGKPAPSNRRFREQRKHWHEGQTVELDVRQADGGRRTVRLTLGG